MKPRRKCPDCGRDITRRYIGAKRCVDCALKHSYEVENARRRAARRAAKC